MIILLPWIRAKIKKLSAMQGWSGIIYTLLWANIYIFVFKIIVLGGFNFKPYYMRQLFISYILILFIRRFYIKDSRHLPLKTKLIELHIKLIQFITRFFKIDLNPFCFRLENLRLFTWLFTWFCFIHLTAVSIIAIVTWNCTMYIRITAGAAFIFWIFGLIALKLQNKNREIVEKTKIEILERKEALKTDNINLVVVKPIIVEQHPYHIVAPSGWPFFLCVFVFDILFFTVRYLHYGLNNMLRHHLIIILICTACVLFFWFKNIIQEGFEGYHTQNVRWNLFHGFILFIISEVMLFFAIFWAFFHSSLSPSIWIDAMWPPLGVDNILPFRLPFFNTLLLLSSGVTLTFSHRALARKNPNYYYTSFGLVWTLILGGLFTCIQVFEYLNAQFAINDGIYGSTFYFATGFHGLHVLIGSIMLLISLIRNTLRQFHPEQHVGFLSAIWYWHFVDVVWVFLFISIYWWGAIS